MMELDETKYDVLVLGTGLIESIISAACARVGKKVLHLEKNEYYGGLNSTFNLKDYIEFFEKKDISPTVLEVEGKEQLLEDLTTPFSNMEIDTPKELINEENLGRFRNYNLDLVPQLYSSRGEMIELLISSGVGRYLEFKILERIYVEVNSDWEKVPFSKEDIFLSQTVGIVDKRRLMKFLTFCLDYENQPQEYINHQDLPFKQFLSRRQIPENIQLIILHAISLSPSNEITTIEGLKKIKEHLSSLGRYGSTAFIWPMYGVSESSQAFCRFSAIFGGIFMLNCFPTKMIVSQENSNQVIKSILIPGGQNIECNYIVSNLDYFPSKLSSTRVSRATLISNSPLHIDSEINLSVVPSNLFGNPNAVYITQSTASTGCCPENKYVTYLYTISSKPTAKEDLFGVVNHLFDFSSSTNIPEETEKSSENEPSENPSEDSKPLKSKPTVLFSAYYNQVIREMNWENKPENVYICPDTGSGLTINEIVLEAKTIFKKLFPEEDFLPSVPHPEEVANVEAILLEQLKTQDDQEPTQES